jgi:hypothetical protein
MRLTNVFSEVHIHTAARYLQYGPENCLAQTIIGFELIKQFPAFVGNQKTLPHLKDPATGIRITPAESNPYIDVYPIYPNIRVLRPSGFLHSK